MFLSPAVLNEIEVRFGSRRSLGLRAGLIAVSLDVSLMRGILVEQ